MRQPSVHLLQEHLQLQADLARVDIISTQWAGPVMPGFEAQLEQVSA